jgi:ribonuclease VapC
MIVVDTSAIVAIWKKEPEAERLATRLSQESPYERRMSAATYLETGAVLAGTMLENPKEAVRRLDRWIDDYSIEIPPLDAHQAKVALEARVKYGRGFGSAAKLNFGDCFSYALAKTLGAPLLYMGEDFPRTDIRSALSRIKRE